MAATIFPAPSTASAGQPIGATKLLYSSSTPESYVKWTNGGAGLTAGKYIVTFSPIQNQGQVVQFCAIDSKRQAVAEAAAGNPATVSLASSATDLELYSYVGIDPTSQEGFMPRTPFNHSTSTTFNRLDYGNNGGQAAQAIGNNVKVMPTSAYGPQYFWYDNGGGWVDAFTASSANRSYNGVAYGNGVFVMVSGNSHASAGDVLQTSTNGVTWTLRTNTVATPNITFGNGVFVCSDGTRSYYSTDGITWQNGNNHGLGAGVANANAMNPLFSNGVFILFNRNTANYVTSTDGISWTARTSPKSFERMGVSPWGFWARGTSVTTPATIQNAHQGWYIYHSNDGIRWTILPQFTSPSQSSTGFFFTPQDNQDNYKHLAGGALGVVFRFGGTATNNVTAQFSTDLRTWKYAGAEGTTLASNLSTWTFYNPQFLVIPNGSNGGGHIVDGVPVNGIWRIYEAN